MKQIMEDFINDRIRVQCKTAKESMEFWEICKTHKLTMSNRGGFKARLRNNEWTDSVFVCGYSGDKMNEVSYWTGPHSNDYDKEIPFTEFMEEFMPSLQLEESILELI